MSENGWPALSRPAPSANDHEVARFAATVAGQELLRLRVSGLPPVRLRTEGDALGQRVLASILGGARPDDAVLSEEAVDNPTRLSAQRVWIIDPLDGTREYGEPPRDDWAVHVALWERGELTAAAVAQPTIGRTFTTGAVSMPPTDTSSRPRIAVSRTRPPDFVEALAEHIDGVLVPMGSAGAKVMAIVRDIADVYVHAGGQYEWDSAAPVAVARAAGLHTSRADGNSLEYNRPDPLLPDLLVCRKELATPVISFVRDQWSR